MYFKNFLACAGLLVASNVSDVSFASCNCDDDGDVKCGASKCDNCDNKGKTGSFDELLLPKLLPRLYVGVVGHGGLAVSKFKGINNATIIEYGLKNETVTVNDGFGGFGPVIGLEKIFFKHLYTAVEIDASWSRYPHPVKYAKNPIDPFSCGLSGRFGLQLGRGTIVYALAGLEINKIRAENDPNKYHYMQTIKNFNGNGDIVSADISFIKLKANERKEHLRLGFGFEHYVWDHLRLRTELLWTLSQRYNVTATVNTLDVNMPTETYDTKLLYSKYQIKLGAIWAF